MYDKDYYCTYSRVKFGKYKMKCYPKISFVYSAPEWVHFFESFVLLNGWVPTWINSYWRHGMSICQESWQIREWKYLLHFTKHVTLYCYRTTWFPRIGREHVNYLTYFPETWHTMINRETKLYYSLEKLINFTDYDKCQPVF